MQKGDENIPASFEEITGVSEEQLKKLDDMVAEIEKQNEALNLVPYNAGGEKYITDRYPIHTLFTRADLQEIATSNYDTLLTEEEIQSTSNVFMDNYPDEIQIAITSAIESVINEREQK